MCLFYMLYIACIFCLLSHKCVCHLNNKRITNFVVATVDFVAFDNVASTLLLVWTGLKWSTVCCLRHPVKYERGNKQITIWNLSWQYSAVCFNAHADLIASQFYWQYISFENYCPDRYTDKIRNWLTALLLH